MYSLAFSSTGDIEKLAFLSPESCSDSMISYLRFSEGSGDNTADEIGPRIIPIAGNAGWTSGKVGSGVSFDGVSESLALEDHASFDWSLTQDFSIGLWFRRVGNQEGFEVILGREEAVGNTHWWVGLTDAKKAAFYLYDENGDGGGIVSSASIDDSLWHHIAAVHRGVQGKNLLYLDGVLVKDSTFLYTTGFGSAEELQIGNFYSGYTHKYFFKGDLDEIAIWNRAVSENEISEYHIKGFNGVDYCTNFDIEPTIISIPDTLAATGQTYSYKIVADGFPEPLLDLIEAPPGMSMNTSTNELTWIPSGAGIFEVQIRAANTAGNVFQNFSIEVFEPCLDGLVSYLSFDEGIGDVALDKGNIQLIDIAGNASWINGVANSGLIFDGVSQGLNRESHPVFDWERTQGLTLELWFRTHVDSPGLQVLMGRETPGKTHWWIGLNDAHQASFYLYDESRSGGGVAGTEALNDNAWHHLAATYEGQSGELSLYVDGIQDNVSSYTYTDNFNSEMDIQIAQLFYNGVNDFFFKGQIDEIAVFSRALTKEEILAHYLKGTHDKGYCDELVLLPAIISTPETTGYSIAAYSYDVDASGLPGPTFSLINPPAEMTIDSATGLIEWMPGTAGEFEIEVIASNIGGEDTQIYTLNIMESCITEGISYLNFEEPSGSIILDQFSARQGQLINNPVRQEGLLGNSILFNGIDQSILLADDDEFDFADSSSFSFELWCRPATDNSNLQVFLGRDEANAVQWWVGQLADSRNPAFYVFDAYRIGNGVVGNKQLSDGRWHHLVAVYDHSLAKLLLYIDGELNAQVDVEFTTGFASTSTIHIGGLYKNDGFQFFYDGALDEIMIYDRALAPEDVSLHYNMGRLGLKYCFKEKIVINAIQDPIEYVDYKVYPIPTQDKLFVEFASPLQQIVDIQLVNMLGICSLKNRMNVVGQIELDISDLKTGLYILRIHGEDSILVQERIIVR